MGTPRHLRGQAGLFVVLNLTLLFGTLGLAVDLGWSYFRRNAAQSAADSAAMAAALYAKTNGYTCGANGVVCGDPVACANPNVSPATTDYQVGCLYAGANGFLNGGNGGRQTVTLQGNTTAPPGLTGNSPAYWVRATVSERTSNFFGSFGGISAFTVNTSAIAGINAVPPGACVYVLDPHLSGAYTQSGGSAVTATCGIFVNSNSSSAFTMNGKSNAAASTILVNGGVSLSSNSTVSPTPTTNAGTVTDPLINLPMPTFSGCDYTNWSTNSDATVDPGVYCGGMKIAGSSNVTFNPGMYVLNGGGFTVTSSGTLSGSHVTFFNTGQSGYTPGAINFGGSETLLFSAPINGSYQGMLFVQDRNLSYTADNKVSGSSASSFTGTFYFPSTTMTFTGSSTGSYTAIVAKAVNFVGTTALKNDPTGTFTGLAVSSASLIN
jgi:hypothetical protein